MIGLELVTDRKTRQPAAIRAVDEIFNDAFKMGVLFLPCGDSVIRFASPMTVDRDFVDKSVEIFSEVLSRIQKEIHL
jgi:4-aminobutyrate aminotransferase